ncbi:NACHT domain-containing protein [Nocardia asteroides]|uniref:NACHT domain-containing protein n=1 Tax=Nocardia asteroides TaxID=1824 RepID=UPI0034446B3C
MTGIEAAAARAVAGASVPVAKRLYRWWRPKSDWASLAGLADGLAAAVDQAEQEVQQELRAGPGAFMPVRFTAAAHQQLEDGINSAEVDEIATYFDLLDKPRRLVVLGEPGAGKTVAATYLVRGLIQRRNELVAVTQRAAEPVPVRVNTAGWDGGQEFSTWLATRLELDYDLPAKVAAKMIKAGVILPVLDGLDEMDDDTTNGERARALLDRLNEREWALRPVVVLCRTTEFDHLTQTGDDNGLHSAATIALDPLAIDQPADHLARYQYRIGAKHPAWDQIIDHLREHTDTPMSITLRNPWMLGLTSTTLHRTPHTAAALLKCLTPDTVRDELFAAQVPAAIAGTEDVEQFRVYTPDNVDKWLHTLARHLEHRRDTDRNGTGIRLDEIWEIAGATRTRVLHILTVALICGLATGLAFGLRLGLAVGLNLGIAGTTGFGVMFGVIIWLSKTPSASRIAWKVPTRTRWPAGLLFGIFAGFVFGTMTGTVAGLLAGLGAGLGVALVFGVTLGLSASRSDQLAMGTDARWLIRHDLRAAAFGGAMFGLGYGLAFGAAEPLVGLQIGLISGFMTALLFGLASGRFLVSTLLFKITADFPSRPAIFLSWARDSGLLRVNATAYQFRHQTYQHWLLHRSDTADPQPAAGSFVGVAPVDARADASPQAPPR